MSIYINGMEMPKDCPMCLMAHYNAQDEFTGCEVVPGRKYAVQKDADYANSSTRPDWCPLVPVPEHGRLIDADAFLKLCMDYAVTPSDYEFRKRLEYALTKAPTIIPANKEATGNV